MAPTVKFPPTANFSLQIFYLLTEKKDLPLPLRVCWLLVGITEGKKKSGIILSELLYSKQSLLPTESMEVFLIRGCFSFRKEIKRVSGPFPHSQQSEIELPPLKRDTSLSCKKFPFSLETDIISCQRRGLHPLTVKEIIFLLEINLPFPHNTTQHTWSISSLPKRPSKERFPFFHK